MRLRVISTKPKLDKAVTDVLALSFSNAFSKAAIEAITAAGGLTEVI